MQLRTMAGNIPNWCETPFAQAMPDKYKKPCAIEAYRDFYWNEKRKFAKWEKGREVPVWWCDLEEKEFDDLMQNKIQVRPHQSLTDAVAVAQKKPMGYSWLWSRAPQAVDVSPLHAASIAYHAARHRNEAIGRPMIL